MSEIDLSQPITGKTLISLGYEPGRWFKSAIEAAEQARGEGRSEEHIVGIIQTMRPPEPLKLDPYGKTKYYLNIDNPHRDNEDEYRNHTAVNDSMQELMRVPTVRSGAVMPDACPAGPKGTIPVGGVIATENAIHPGMHSADVCCSVAVSYIKHNIEPSRILDAAMKCTHFGPGPRQHGVGLVTPGHDLFERFRSNQFLRESAIESLSYFASQGDGNHFLFLGMSKKTGELAIVTHHGSRKPGASLYKRGMQLAEKYRKELCPEVSKHNAWIPADTKHGEEYWEALQIIREWTKRNHFAIHTLISRYLDLKVTDWVWNEHNFVFRKSDGLFYHAKGATPAFSDWAPDATDFTLIPLNMAEPVLVTRGRDAKHGLGFSPHGAGRNFSRSAYLRRIEADRMSREEKLEHMAEQVAGLDIRFYCGYPDLSEFPNAYKDASMIKASIGKYDLANVVDEILPIGTIMAGDWQAFRRAKGF